MGAFIYIGSTGDTITNSLMIVKSFFQPFLSVTEILHRLLFLKSSFLKDLRIQIDVQMYLLKG